MLIGIKVVGYTRGAQLPIGETLLDQPLLGQHIGNYRNPVRKIATLRRT